jgi:GNAT superfamily N-acetyltransferase
MVELMGLPNGQIEKMKRVSGVKVRLATEDDAATIFRLLCAFHSESRYRVHEFNGPAVQDSIKSMVSDPKAHAVFLTERADVGVTGLLAAYAAPLFFAKVVTANAVAFYVLPGYRGGASAAKLLIAFKRWGLSRGAAELAIHATADIDRKRFNRLMAHAGYQSSGKNYEHALVAIAGAQGLKT